ncbi:MAG: hypothetical protein VR65_04435 [Desulfobulbaceae bacterium BRH_c16a]|nr:MAG: hypothetical protein VR65_04435 [Desulfobulbaceae bacterium BRH_c16a]
MKPKPQKQGVQDGACGFYAIGNAISILIPKVPVDEIFKIIFKYYLENENGEHFIEGMYRNKLNSILTHTVETLNEKGHGIGVYRPFWNNTANSLGDFKENIFEHFKENCIATAIIGYEYCKIDPESDYYSHWTTINRTTTKSFYTFDSDQERKFIPLSKCRIWDDKKRHKSRPYKIDTTATFFLSKKKIKQIV